MTIFSNCFLCGRLFYHYHLFPYNSLDHLHGDKYDNAKAQYDLDISARGFDDPKGIAYRRDLNEYRCQYDLR